MMKHITHATKPISSTTINRRWVLIDVSGKILGRTATQIANALSGKNKVTYSPNLDSGDNVVVINASLVKVTGRKALQKVYQNYSGYPGGLHKEALGKKMERRPTDVVRRAVSGMLAKNKLRDRKLARLHIYRNEIHPYSSRITVSK